MRGAHLIHASRARRAAQQQAMATVEWRAVTRFRPNVLVRTRAPKLLIRTFWSFARTPIEVVRAWRTPTIKRGTLVLERVDRLGASEQRALFDWVARHGAVQCISLTRRPLYPLVASGRFLAELYYRLNAMYISGDACPLGAY